MEPLPRTITVGLKDRLRCIRCGFVWERALDKKSNPCPNCSHIIDARIRKDRDPNIEKLWKWKLKNKSQTKKGRKIYRERLRKSILYIVGRGRHECVRCGCGDWRLLEINHINGGGAAEIRKSGFYYNIYKGRRDIKDLELLCKVCNMLHYMELKHGKLPYNILWAGNDVQNKKHIK